MVRQHKLLELFRVHFLSLSLDSIVSHNVNYVNFKTRQLCLALLPGLWLAALW